MTPSVLTVDPSDDLSSGATAPSPSRTLLLAPPSLASHPSALTTAVSQFDRSITDLQMIDRLSAGLVRLPAAAYDRVLLLDNATASLAETLPLLTRSVLGHVAESLKPRGRLQAHDGSDLADPSLTREAVLAGLVASQGGFDKPDYDGEATVSLKLKKKKKDTIDATPAPPGVGFVDLSDDLDDEELIDEDTLLNEDDLNRPINIPIDCQPKPGKRRRACKDCTCGLADRIAAEDAAQRAKADETLATFKLAADDLAEVDFTVQGKVGSCGNCALGDAFRCDGCPYIGLPPFKPGEEVRLLNNEVQL